MEYWASWSKDSEAGSCTAITDSIHFGYPDRIDASFMCKIAEYILSRLHNAGRQTAEKKTYVTVDKFDWESMGWHWESCLGTPRVTVTDTTRSPQLESVQIRLPSFVCRYTFLHLFMFWIRSQHMRSQISKCAQAQPINIAALSGVLPKSSTWHLSICQFEESSGNVYYGAVLIKG